MEVRAKNTGTEWQAHIDGIPACGTGSSEAEAVRSLACLLGDFVLGHRCRIQELEQELAAQEIIPAWMKW